MDNSQFIKLINSSRYSRRLLVLAKKIMFTKCDIGQLHLGTVNALKQYMIHVLCIHIWKMKWKRNRIQNKKYCAEWRICFFAISKDERTTIKKKKNANVQNTEWKHKLKIYTSAPSLFAVLRSHFVIRRKVNYYRSVFSLCCSVYLLLSLRLFFSAALFRLHFYTYSEKQCLHCSPNIIYLICCIHTLWAAREHTLWAATKSIPKKQQAKAMAKKQSVSKFNGLHWRFTAFAMRTKTATVRRAGGIRTAETQENEIIILVN